MNDCCVVVLEYRGFLDYGLKAKIKMTKITSNYSITILHSHEYEHQELLLKLIFVDKDFMQLEVIALPQMMPSRPGKINEEKRNLLMEASQRVFRDKKRW
jgi:hypothetical protein